MSKFKIIPLQFDDLIRKVTWNNIRQDILKTARKTKSPWHPVDVLRLAREDKAFVADLQFDNQHIGTLVLRPIVEEFDDKSLLHVWILALEQTQLKNESDLLDDVWQFVQEEAIRSGCKTIQVVSARKGWKRRLARYGFNESPYRAYHKEVNYHG